MEKEFDSRLKIEHIKAGYDKKTNVIQDLSLKIPNHQISVILGSNGCGKSTFLKTLARLLKIKEGAILLDGKMIKDFKNKEYARQVGLLPQKATFPDGITVLDLVTRGRFPYRKPLAPLSKEDYEAINEALNLMGVSDLKDKSIDELSGGQAQRVWIALALVQNSEILLLDEPTTYLDIAYQIEILDSLKKINQERKTTIVMVLHDINLSIRYADYIFAFKDGNLVQEGKPDEIINEDLIKEIYDLDSVFLEDPIMHKKVLVPLSKAK